jgi:hypothetical protein
MTPYTDNVGLAQVDNTLVRLANHSPVSATLKGVVSLPLNAAAHVPALVIPDLHEPLLSVAGVCDKNFTVVFDSTSCQIFHPNTMKKKLSLDIK